MKTHFEVQFFARCSVPKIFKEINHSFMQQESIDEKIKNAKQIFTKTHLHFYGARRLTRDDTFVVFKPGTGFCIEI